jgi:peptidoglycan L-alanyl-D-glutamate endopeptidase CwlK
MDIEEIIKRVQRKLGVEDDGKAGPITWTAIYEEIVGTDSRPAPNIGALTEHVDERSERSIGTLLAEVKPFARSLVLKAAEAGVKIKVIGGTRTYAEQDALYAKGRNASGVVVRPREVVTNAKGGQSNHNFGIAFDIGVFEGSSYLGDSPKYKAVGVLGEQLGLEWGGNWTSFKDQPHFQLRPGWATDLTEREMLAELRRRKAGGRPVFG